jgi:TRAP-type mannitol/chloroaromatic compound transport system permease small subunit
MNFLLSLSKRIDAFSEWMGRWVAWLVLFAVLISAGNASVRKAFNMSSNAFLEIQWYLFAAAVMLGAGMVLRVNEHVRVDVIYGQLSTRAKVYIDLMGLVFFLLPVMVLMMYLSYPLFIDKFYSGEVSSNAGGLIRWPVWLMLPLGYLMILLQGISEIIKRVGWLTNQYEMNLVYERPLQ